MAGTIKAADAELIAHAPTDLADLLDEREVLIADRQSAEQVADDYHEEILAAHAENDALRAVVEAAGDLIDCDPEDENWDRLDYLLELETAYRAYRAATTEGE